MAVLICLRLINIGKVYAQRYWQFLQVSSGSPTLYFIQGIKHPRGLCSVTQLCPTLWPHKLQPVRLLWPWNFPGRNTGVGCHFLLQRIFRTQGSNQHFLCQVPYHWCHQRSPNKTFVINEAFWFYIWKQNMFMKQFIAFY